MADLVRRDVLKIVVDLRTGVGVVALRVAEEAEGPLWSAVQDDVGVEDGTLVVEGELRNRQRTFGGWISVPRIADCAVVLVPLPVPHGIRVAEDEVDGGKRGAGGLPRVERGDDSLHGMRIDGGHRAIHDHLDSILRPVCGSSIRRLVEAVRVCHSRLEPAY